MEPTKKAMNTTACFNILIAGFQKPCLPEKSGTVMHFPSVFENPSDGGSVSGYSGKRPTSAGMHAPLRPARYRLCVRTGVDESLSCHAGKANGAGSGAAAGEKEERAY